MGKWKMVAFDDRKYKHEKIERYFLEDIGLTITYYFSNKYKYSFT
jgi:hypothetical protein